MKKMTFDIEVSPWLTEEGLHINLYVNDSYIETELDFTLQDLIDDEIIANTVHGNLIEPELLDGFIKYLEKAAQHAKKRVKELSQTAHGE